MKIGDFGISFSNLFRNSTFFEVLIKVSTMGLYSKQELWNTYRDRKWLPNWNTSTYTYHKLVLHSLNYIQLLLCENLIFHFHFICIYWRPGLRCLFIYLVGQNMYFIYQSTMYQSKQATKGKLVLTYSLSKFHINIGYSKSDNNEHE